MDDKDQFEYEVWATYQELTMDDVCNAINDSPAILRAIHNNNFTDAAEMIKKRVDRSVSRLAEYRLFGKYLSQPVDPRMEMLDYRDIISKRANAKEDPFRSFQ